MTGLSPAPMDLSPRLRSLLANTRPGSDPLDAIQSGEHSRSLLTNEIKSAAYSQARPGIAAVCKTVGSTLRNRWSAGQSTLPSWDGLRAGMADMGVVRDACTRRSLRPSRRSGSEGAALGVTSCSWRSDCGGFRREAAGQASRRLAGGFVLPDHFGADLAALGDRQAASRAHARTARPRNAGGGPGAVVCSTLAYLADAEGRLFG